MSDSGGQSEQEQGGENVTLSLTAGGAGGVWYIVMAGIAEFVKEKDPSIEIKVVPGAGLVNNPRVGTNEVELGCSFPPFIAMSIKGADPYDTAYPDIRGVFKGYGDSVGHFIVGEDTGFNSIDEIFENKYPLKMAAERVGATDEWLFSKVCEFYGVTYDDIASWGGKVTHAGYNDMGILYKDRHVDGMFANIAAPWGVAMDAQISRPIKVLPFSEELQEYLIQEYSFSKGEVPAGSYTNQDEAIPSVASIGTLTAHKDVPEDAIYRITKIICENPDRVWATHDSAKVFDPEKAWDALGAPLHPGAEKYYKEKGYIK
jgi:TRAP transporter TAXI family solute receptor